MNELLDRVFILNCGVKQRCAVVTSEPVSSLKVTMAWSYAVQHTMQQPNTHNYPAAIELLKIRHPNWLVIPSALLTIEYIVALADGDVDEGVVV